MTFKSTLGAPLTEPECARILDAWNALNSFAKSISFEDVEPDTMLDACTDLIMLVWEVRRAISDGWYEANKRAWPTPVRATPRPKPQSQLAVALSALTSDQINEVLEAINSGELNK